MEIIILICFIILSVLCICMLSTILFFMFVCNKRLCSLEDDVYDIRLNKASYQYLRSVKNGLECDIRDLERDVKGAFINIGNVDDKIENLYDFKYCLDEKTDAILEDLKRTKVNVQRLNVCETCNDYILRSLDRKVKILMSKGEEKNA